MMEINVRQFAPLVNVSLDQLVPRDHFYRHLDRMLDLTFVRELVRPYYAAGGRPSIDPVVFFKLQLVMFFEDLRSERHLLRVAADRLSVRWYLGYDLSEPLPDHSSMTTIRDRYGVDIFRRFFDAIVEQCRQARLVWGAELYFDVTQVEANADRMVPRFYHEALAQHLATLFPDEPAAPRASLSACFSGGAGAADHGRREPEEWRSPDWEQVPQCRVASPSDWHRSREGDRTGQCSTFKGFSTGRMTVAID
jgi:transposase